MSRRQPWRTVARRHGWTPQMADIHRINTDITPQNASPHARRGLGTRGDRHGSPRLADQTKGAHEMDRETTNDPCPRCRGEEYLDGDNGMVLCPRCCGTGDA
jgi:DnaJ-class molecular chaperone